MSCKLWSSIAFGRLVALTCVAFAPIAAWAQEPASSEHQPRPSREERLKSRVSRTAEPIEGFSEVELFEAMKSGDIQVRFRALSSTAANVFVTNNTDRPLSIQMPPAFAGVPVLAQGALGGGAGGMGGLGGMGGGLGGMGGGMGGMGGMGGQGIGGGFGGGMGGGMGGFGGGMGGFGGGMGGMGGGAFNIPPGEVGKLKVSTFCLEHGKPDPVPQMEYTIVPLETVTTDPAIEQLCRLLANDQINTQVAQAAAWNIANGLSWDALLQLNRVELMDGSFERFFSPAEIAAAQQVANWARGQASLIAAERSNPDTESSESRVQRLAEQYGRPEQEPVSAGGR